jgi:hypothetical protein
MHPEATVLAVLDGPRAGWRRNRRNVARLGPFAHEAPRNLVAALCRVLEIAKCGLEKATSGALVRENSLKVPPLQVGANAARGLLSLGPELTSFVVLGGTWLDTTGKHSVLQLTAGRNGLAQSTLPAARGVAQLRALRDVGPCHQRRP